MSATKQTAHERNKRLFSAIMTMPQRYARQRPRYNARGYEPDLNGTAGDLHRRNQTDPSLRGERSRAVSVRMSRAGTALCVCGD